MLMISKSANKMYVIILTLVLLSSISGSPFSFPGSFLQMKQEHPKPCCAPSSFTQEIFGTLTSVKNGELFEEHRVTKLAYDAVGEKIASRIHLGFTNGTEEAFVLIDFYKKRESYIIYISSEGEACYRDELTKSFHRACIPDHAHYGGSGTLGDRALEVNIWNLFYESPVGNTSFEGFYTEDECVAITNQYKRHNPDTGKLEEILDLFAMDFKLGICDEDKIFHVPEICDKSKLSKGVPKVPEGLMKFHRLIRRAGLFFGGQ